MSEAEKEAHESWLEKRFRMVKEKVHMTGMKPAFRSLYCCSVAAASAVIAVYVLVAYTIAFAFELVWLIEANKEKFPPASAILIFCYFIILAATLALIHGLFTDNPRCLLMWLVAVILVLIPECSIVFYMSISYWGLNNVYGASQMICYISRLPALVAGIVIVQSCYALKKANAKNIIAVRKISNNLGHLTESEFNASLYLPNESGTQPPSGIYTNGGFVGDENKLSRSMPDLRKQMDSIRVKQSNHKVPPIYMMPPMPPPCWLIRDVNEQNIANTAYQQMYRTMPHYHAAHFGTLPRRHHWFESQRQYPLHYHGYPCVNEQQYVEYLNPEQKMYEMEKPDVTDAPSFKDNMNNEMKYRNFEHSSFVEGHGMRSNSTEDLRVVHTHPQYGINLLQPKPIDGYKNDPFNLSVPRERVFYGPIQGLSTSHNSFGNESDDMTKYRDIAL